MKNFSFLVLGAFLFFSCQTEQNCAAKKGDTVIKLKTKINAGSISNSLILEKREVSDRIILDTLELDENGEGKFVVKLEGIEVLSIRKMNEQDEIILVADKGETIEITSTYEELGNRFRLKGTKEVEALDEFIEMERFFQHFADSLNQVYLKLKQVNEHYAVEDEFNALYQKKMLEREKRVQQFIDQDNSRFINLIAVRSLDVKRFPDYYKKVKLALEKKYPASNHVNVFAQDVDRISASEVGGIAPVFNLPDFNGKERSLKEFKGKYVLLDFWATWCRPCIAEIPNLKKVQNEFKDKNFQLVSICIDRADFRPNWQKIIQENKMDWPQLFDATGVSANDYSIEFFPTIFLLNDKGEIIAKNLRGEEIARKLREIFK